MVPDARVILGAVAPTVLLAAAVLALPWSATLFHSFFPELRTPVYARAGFTGLLLAHMRLVVLSTWFRRGSVASPPLVFVTRPSGRSFAALARLCGTVGQSVPPGRRPGPRAWPMLGYGGGPRRWPALRPLRGACRFWRRASPGSPQSRPRLATPLTGSASRPCDGSWQWNCRSRRRLILTGLRSATIINIGTATNWVERRGAGRSARRSSRGSRRLEPGLRGAGRGGGGAVGDQRRPLVRRAGRPRATRRGGRLTARYSSLAEFTSSTSIDRPPFWVTS